MATEPYSYIAYIDESGDDGLNTFRSPGIRGGSSCWLVISACVYRFSSDWHSIEWRDKILAQMPEKRSKRLHFVNLNHGQKVAAVQYLAKQRMRAINILANKEVIPEGIYRDKNQLYFYLARYLIERLSWLCRDYRRIVRDGNGRVKIVFSRRGGMSYDRFKEYLTLLKADPTVRIHWPVIDIDGVEAHDHSRRAGLQLVDAIASSVAAGVEPNFYGNCESRYAEILKPIIYERDKNYLSYGMKALPWFHEMELSDEQKRFVKLFEKERK
jgi:hypothetical protein